MILGFRTGGYENFCLMGYSRVVRLKFTDVAEKHAATIFRVDESARTLLPVSCGFLFDYSPTLTIEAIWLLIITAEGRYFLSCRGGCKISYRPESVLVEVPYKWPHFRPRRLLHCPYELNGGI
jgi:hypothetical protein